MCEPKYRRGVQRVGLKCLRKPVCNRFSPARMRWYLYALKKCKNIKYRNAAGRRNGVEASHASAHVRRLASHAKSAGVKLMAGMCAIEYLIDRIAAPVGAS